MNTKSKKAASLALSATAGVSLVLGGVAAIPLTSANGATLLPNDDITQAGSSAYNARLATQNVQLEQVMGAFAYDQNKVDSNEAIAKNIGKASAVLCGTQGSGDLAVSSAISDEAWAIQIGGAVENAYTLTEGELSENKYEKRIMKCACSGNPTDGTAVAQAHVAGVSVADIVTQANPAEGVNTIVFTSVDGYEVALPLKYVQQRSSLIAYKVNDECLDASVGGHNQLWLGRTSARYFARDIVKVSLERRETPPPAPGTKEARESYANNPNIAVRSGGAGAEL